MKQHAEGCGTGTLHIMHVVEIPCTHALFLVVEPAGPIDTAATPTTHDPDFAPAARSPARIPSPVDSPQ
ncbi:MAG: hypothetical protein WAW16_07945 [Candidatus Cryosericum sp.]